MTVNMDDAFPVGMRVLAADDDVVSLESLASLLLECKYAVTSTSHAITAVKLLQDAKYKFDLIIMDVDMPGIDGRKLLDNVVGLNTGVPIIIMMSPSSNRNLLTRHVEDGACEFMLKPARIENLQNIWQHVIRRRNNLRPKELNNPLRPRGELFEASKESTGTENVYHNRKPHMNSKHQNDEEKKREAKETHDTPKKRRVVWTQDLHEKFTAAVAKLGLEKAVPKRILELMNDENLTRANVASHLQKYKLYLKRSSESTNKYFGSVDSTFRQNVNGVDKQSMVGNMYLSDSAPIGIIGLSDHSSSSRISQAGNIMNTNDHVYGSIQLENQSLPCDLPKRQEYVNKEQNDVISPVAEFPYMDSGIQSSIPSRLGYISGFDDDWTPTRSLRLSCDLRDFKSVTGDATIRPHENSLTPFVNNTLPDIKTDLHYQTHQSNHVFSRNINHNMVSSSNGCHVEFGDQQSQAFLAGNDPFYEGSRSPLTIEDFDIVQDVILDDGRFDTVELTAGLGLHEQAANYPYNNVDMAKGWNQSFIKLTEKLKD